MSVHCVSTRCVIVLICALAKTALSVADVYDLAADWSDANNPNGVWSYNEDGQPLPHVDWWQHQLGGFATAQPGWADSEDGNDRLPVWFKSAAQTTFANDFQIGDVVVHTTDPVNGVGNGPALLTWASPACGRVDISGAVWLARNIGRSDRWTLLEHGTAVSSGEIFDGDPYDRANPMDLSLGTGGPDVLSNVPVAVGSVIALRIERTSNAGEFVGVRLTITTSAQSHEPGDLDCSGGVDFNDINPFVLALQDPLTYGVQYPTCNYCNGDCDLDGDIDFDDISPFVAILSGR